MQAQQANLVNLFSSASGGALIETVRFLSCAQLVALCGTCTLLRGCGAECARFAFKSLSGQPPNFASDAAALCALVARAKAEHNHSACFATTRARMCDVAVGFIQRESTRDIRAAALESYMASSDLQQVRDALGVVIQGAYVRVLLL